MDSQQCEVLKTEVKQQANDLISSLSCCFFQLLQGEESLLNLMMENSMQSTWKTPQLGRRPRASAKPRARGQPAVPNQHQTLVSTAAASATGSPSTAKNLWASVTEETPGQASRRGDRSRGSTRALHHHHHQTRSSDAHKDPAPQPPISKMDSCHISEDRGPWHSIRAGFTSGPSPASASSPRVTVSSATVLRPRLRLSRQGKPRGRSVAGGLAGLESVDLPITGKDMSLLDAAETDGYFSDGEQSDSDMRSGGRKLRLSQLHPGNEDLLRRSVLAL